MLLTLGSLCSLQQTAAAPDVPELPAGAAEAEAANEQCTSSVVF